MKVLQVLKLTYLDHCMDLEWLRMHLALYLIKCSRTRPCAGIGVWVREVILGTCD